MTAKRFKLSYPNGAFLIDGDKPLCSIENDLMIVDLLNELAEENKKLTRENESLNSQLIRLDNELFCQDCLTCRHSEKIDITVKCGNGNGITDYQMGCDFYEISEEWVEE